MSKLFTVPTISFCFVLLLSLASGCGHKNTVQPTLTEPVSVLTGAEIIGNSSWQMQTVNSYHFVLDQSGGGTPLGIGLEMNKAVGDVVRPDKLKATISGTFAGMSLEVQLVSSAGVARMTNPVNGNWEEPPAQFNVLSLFDPNTGIAAIMNGMANITRLDDASSSRVLLYHLSGNINSKDLSSITGISLEGTSIKVEVWIGQNDWLVRNIQLTGQITETEVPGIVRRLTLSNFNSPVSIELPK